MLKIFKRKKGMILILALSILFSVIMGMLFVKIESKKSQFNATIGETQIQLIETYLEGEKILLYIDQASKYATYQAIYDLAESGGFFYNKCGQYKGYGLWQNQTNDLEYCSPTYEENLGTFITTRLDSSLNNAPFDTIIPRENYDFVFKDEKINGIATLPIHLKIKCEKKKTECGEYNIKPSFTHNIGHNLDIYEQIKNKLREISEECSIKQDLIDSDDLEQCVEIRISQDRELTWSIKTKEAPTKDREDRNFAFDIISNKKLPFHEDQITYKLAVSIPDEAPPPKVESITITPTPPNKVTLRWEKSKALDVEKYKIYYTESNNNKDCKKISELYNNPPHDITKSDLTINKPYNKDPTNPDLIIQEMTIDTTKKYCFAATAIDELNNEIALNTIEGIKYP